MTASVLVDDLHLAYGGAPALDGVDLETAPGSTLAILGHNGAGKTTLIRVLTTLARPDRGRALVDGYDVVTDAAQVRRRIGVTGQFAGLDDFLTGRENLELVGHLSGLGGNARRRANELIARLGLEDLAAKHIGGLSGGSRRRVDLAASLVGDPSVLFLDEPTTGLDPMARTALWDVIADLTATGTTVVLTTQYLEEADRLADHVVVLDHGRVAARGTPAELKRIVGGKLITAVVPVEQLDLLPSAASAEQRLDADRVRVVLAVGGTDSAAHVIGQLTAQGIELADLDVASPSLDDVVRHLTYAGATS
jgi:ABC-2 type transport system ATP-binding protein